MGTHTVTLCFEQDCIAVKRKARRTTHVSAVGQVNDGTVALCADKSYVGVRVMFVADKFEGEPFAVRRPRIAELAICAVPGGAVGYLAYFLRFEIEYHQPDAVFDEGKFLAVR